MLLPFHRSAPGSIILTVLAADAARGAVLDQHTIHVQRKQVGYRHFGDIELLEFGADAKSYDGRFIDRACPLPMALTGGSSTVAFEIHAGGPVSSYDRSLAQCRSPLTRKS